MELGQGGESQGEASAMQQFSETDYDEHLHASQGRFPHVGIRRYSEESGQSRESERTPSEESEERMENMDSGFSEYWDEDIGQYSASMNSEMWRHATDASEDYDEGLGYQYAGPSYLPGQPTRGSSYRQSGKKSRRKQTQYQYAVQEFPDGEGGPPPRRQNPYLRMFLEITGIAWFLSKLVEETLRQEEEGSRYPAVHRLVRNVRFEAVMGSLILLNALCIGWDTYYLPGDVKPAVLAMSEHIFTLIFVIEFFLRIMAFSWVWVFKLWNFCDAMLVWVTGVLVIWILVPAGADAEFLRKMTAVRILRLARLCRSLRMLPEFKELWVLVQGLTDSARLMLWTYVIVGAVLWVFGIGAVDLIGRSEVFADNEEIQEWFGSPGAAVFTLFQIMTLDSWTQISRPVITEMPETLLLFGLFIGIASFVLFNLMTAIIVENAFEAAARDEEAVAKLKQVAQLNATEELRVLFAELDEDESGQLSRAEFTDVLDDPRFIQKMKTLDVELEDLPDVFNICDDGDGQVSTEEFCTGLMKMQGLALTKDMMNSMKHIKQLSRKVDILGQTMRATKSECASVHEAFDNLHVNSAEAMKVAATLLERVSARGVEIAVATTMEDLPEVPEPRVEKKGKHEAKEEHDELIHWLQNRNREMMKPKSEAQEKKKRAEERTKSRSPEKKGLPDEAEGEQQDYNLEVVHMGWERLDVKPHTGQTPRMRHTVAKYKDMSWAFQGVHQEEAMLERAKRVRKSMMKAEVGQTGSASGSKKGPVRGPHSEVLAEQNAHVMVKRALTTADLWGGEEAGDHMQEPHTHGRLTMRAEEIWEKEFKRGKKAAGEDRAALMQGEVEKAQHALEMAERQLHEATLEVAGQPGGVQGAPQPSVSSPPTLGALPPAPPAGGPWVGLQQMQQPSTGFMLPDGRHVGMHGQGGGQGHQHPSMAAPPLTMMLQSGAGWQSGGP